MKLGWLIILFICMLALVSVLLSHVKAQPVGIAKCVADLRDSCMKESVYNGQAAFNDVNASCTRRAEHVCNNDTSEGRG